MHRNAKERETDSETMPFAVKRAFNSTEGRQETLLCNALVKDCAIKGRRDLMDRKMCFMGRSSQFWAGIS